MHARRWAARTAGSRGRTCCTDPRGRRACLGGRSWSSRRWWAAQSTGRRAAHCADSRRGRSRLGGHSWRSRGWRTGCWETRRRTQWEACQGRSRSNCPGWWGKCSGWRRAGGREPWGRAEGVDRIGRARSSCFGRWGKRKGRWRTGLGRAWRRRSCTIHKVFEANKKAQMTLLEVCHRWHFQVSVLYCVHQAASGPEGDLWSPLVPSGQASERKHEPPRLKTQPQEISSRPTMCKCRLRCNARSLCAWRRRTATQTCSGCKLNYCLSPS